MSDLVWAAGLFEGEGCITISRVSGRAYLSLSVSMHARDADVLARFRAAVGHGNVAGPHANGMLRWSVTGKPAVAVAELADFVANLGARRRERLAECLDLVIAQPRALTHQEIGKIAGRASAQARRVRAAA